MVSSNEILKEGSPSLAGTIAATLAVSRATVYRVLAEQTDDGS